MKRREQIVITRKTDNTFKVVIMGRDGVLKDYLAGDLIVMREIEAELKHLEVIK